MNSFHRLANMKPRSERPNVAVNATKKQIAEDGSEKQRRYHRDLVAFLKENGLNTVAFEKPRDGRECGRFINAMITVLKKHELFDTFFSGEEKV